MKKFLTLAIILLTLFAANKSIAQNYSSELGVGDLIRNAWNNAQDSNADIYTEVYDDWGYEFNDYSEYGDFSQEVVFSDGTRYQYGYDNSSNMIETTVGYGETNVNKLSEYDKTKLRNHNLVVLTNGNAYNTLKRVVHFMLSRTQQTGNEIAAVKLLSENYVIFKDINNTPTRASIFYDPKPANCRDKYYNGDKITAFYHVHPEIESMVDLDISPEDKRTASVLNCDYIYIIGPDGTLYMANAQDSTDYETYYW